MADSRNSEGIGTAITPANSPSWSQQPGETPEAYAAFRAYLELGPGNRSIAEAYRRLKGVGPDAKTPGYFGRWSSQWNWRQRAADWDAHVDRLSEVTGLAELQAARKQTIEQAEDLQGVIQAELEEVRRLMDRDQRRPEDPFDQSARLANLAAALESAARARLMALGGGETDT